MKINRKTYYLANFILLFVVLMISFVVAMVVTYNDQSRFVTEKTDLFTEQVNEEFDSMLNRINTTSRTIFLNEGFQDLTEEIYSSSDDGILQIYDHFNLFLSMDDLIKNALYIPRNAEGVLDGENAVIYSYGFDYVFENISLFIELAESEEYLNGKAFFTKLYEPDGKEMPYFALVRLVIDIRPTSYFEKMGVGVLVFNSLKFTEVLNSYAMALDGLSFFVTDGTENIVTSKNFNEQTFVSGRNYSKRVVLNNFDWNLVGVFDKTFVWSGIKDNFIWLTVVMLISSASTIALAIFLKRRSSASLDYLFNTFSKFKKESAIAIIPQGDDEEVNQVISSFNEMVNSVQTLNDQMLKQKNRELALELRNVEYMLNSLHSQINKHFMINILSILRSFIYCGEYDRAKKCIEDLSDFLRSALSIEDTGTIGEELSMVRSYLNLQTSRYPNIEVEIECDEENFDIEIPKMILQPVIENSFVHGLQSKKGKIRVVCKVRPNFVTFFVIDNGLGIDQEKVKLINKNLKENKKTEIKIGNGIALYNIKQRLRLLTSQKSSMHVLSKKGQGTIVVLKIYRGE